MGDSKVKMIIAAREDEKDQRLALDCCYYVQLTSNKEDDLILKALVVV